MTTVGALLAQAHHWRAFGEGAASNVCQFRVSEAAKGGSTTFVQSSATDGWADRDYAFYARTNTSSAEAFTATLRFCSQVVSHVCASKAWTTLKAGKVAKVIVPRVLFAFDRGSAGFRSVTDPMCLARKELRASVDDPDNALIPFESVAVVEGSHCMGITDLLVRGARKSLDIRTHAMEVGMLHAIDVALGMGDRLQNPNAANVTVNPTTLQTIIIDMDTCLPPLKCGPYVDALCERSSYESKIDGRGTAGWKYWPPLFPQQGAYKASVDKALRRDLGRYLRGNGSVSDRAGGPGEKYAAAFLSAGTPFFLKAAKMTLTEIKAGMKDGRFNPGVEDETFSSKRLERHASQWGGIFGM